VRVPLDLSTGLLEPSESDCAISIKASASVGFLIPKKFDSTPIFAISCISDNGMLTCASCVLLLILVITAFLVVLT
jgi:hypothetical protein